MENRIRRWLPVVQTFGVIIGVISLLLNAVQYAENKAVKSAKYQIERDLGRRVAEATARWLGAERRIAEHETRIVDLNIEVSDAIKRMQKHRSDAEHFRDESLKFKAIAEYYEGKYKDFEPILDLTDSEHFEFFLRWTTPGL